MIRQLWFVTRLALIVLASLYALLFLMNNSGQSAAIWYWPFRPAEQLSILSLAIVSFALGLGLGVGTYATYNGIAQIRKAREMKQLRHIAELNRKAAMLRVRPIVTRKAEPSPTIVSEPAPMIEAPVETVTTPPEPIELVEPTPAPTPVEPSEASSDPPKLT